MLVYNTVIAPIQGTLCLHAPSQNHDGCTPTYSVQIDSYPRDENVWGQHMSSLQMPMGFWAMVPAETTGETAMVCIRTKESTVFSPRHCRRKWWHCHIVTRTSVKPWVMVAPDWSEALGLHMTQEFFQALFISWSRVRTLGCRIGRDFLLFSIESSVVICLTQF